MKQVFIFTGDPASGKTVLGNLIDIKNKKVIVMDELPNIKLLGKLGFERRFSLEYLKDYDYAIYITNYQKNIDYIKEQFPDIPVSVCKFRR